MREAPRVGLFLLAGCIFVCTAGPVYAQSQQANWRSEEGGCPCNIAMVPSGADVWDDALCVRFADRDGRPAVMLKSANELNVLNIGVGHWDLNPFCSFVHSARLAGMQYYENLTTDQRTVCIQDVLDLAARARVSCTLHAPPK